MISPFSILDAFLKECYIWKYEQDQNRLLQDREQDHFSIDLQDHKSISVEWLGRKISDARCWECIEKQYAF